MKLVLDNNAIRIIQLLQNNGFSAYAVGGCVRDAIIGRHTDDCDITTSALPDQVKWVLSDFQTVDTGLQHGTVTVIADGKPYEITTFRTEDSYSDSRHPDKVFFIPDLKTDLSRRDFTMNAIAYNQKEGIIDPFGAADDIKNKIIRTVGDPEKRFEEDALRILRALRFSATLGFEIEVETANAINDLAQTVNKVSAERIYTEIKKLICGDHADTVLNQFKTALSKIIPVDDYVNRISMLPKDFPMRLTYLCREDVLTALNDLRADNYTKKHCELLIRSTPIPDDETKIKFYISNLGRENANYVINYRRIVFGEDEFNITNKIMSTCSCLSISELNVNGNDIKNLGIYGSSIAKAQETLLERVIKGEIENRREVLLEQLKSLDNSAL